MVIIIVVVRRVRSVPFPPRFRFSAPARFSAVRRSSGSARPRAPAFAFGTVESRAKTETTDVTGRDRLPAWRAERDTRSSEPTPRDATRPGGRLPGVHSVG